MRISEATKFHLSTVLLVLVLIGGWALLSLYLERDIPVANMVIFLCTSVVFYLWHLARYGPRHFWWDKDRFFRTVRFFARLGKALRGFPRASG